MGKNNKARRAAKAKQRAKRGTPRSRGAGRFGGGFDFDFDDMRSAPDPNLQIAGLWLELENAAGRGDPDVQDWAERLATHPGPLVDGHAEEILQQVVGALWDAGSPPSSAVRCDARARPRQPG